MKQNYSIRTRTFKDKDGIDQVQVEGKKSKEFFNLLPHYIQEKYREYGIDIDKVDNQGNIVYWTPVHCEIENHNLELDFIMNEKGFQIEFMGNDAESYYSRLKTKVTSIVGKGKQSQFLWERINSKYEWEEVIPKLEENIKNSDAVLFFGAHLDNKHIIKSNLVFKISSFQSNKLRNYQYLTEYDDFNSPFNYYTMYKGEQIPVEGFITDEDMTWVFCFNHEGYLILTDL